MWIWLRRWYCRLFHWRIMYVGGSRYVCRHCGQVWKIPW